MQKTTNIKWTINTDITTALPSAPWNQWTYNGSYPEAAYCIVAGGYTHINTPATVGIIAFYTKNTNLDAAKGYWVEFQMRVLTSAVADSRLCVQIADGTYKEAYCFSTTGIAKTLGTPASYAYTATTLSVIRIEVTGNICLININGVLVITSTLSYPASGQNFIGFGDANASGVASNSLWTYMRQADYPYYNFELNREARANILTYRAQLDYENLALTLKGATATAVTTLGAKYPVNAILNGDITHKNYGLDVGDTGYDNLFPAENVYASDTSFAFQYVTIDLGATKTFNRIEIYGHPYLPDCTQFLVKTSLDGSFWTTFTNASYMAVEGHNKDNNPVPAVSVDGTGWIYTNATAHTLYLNADASGRYVRIECTTKPIGTSYKLCAVRIYQTIDITADLLSVNASEKMTYNLKKYMARSCNITLRNYERFYSPDVNTNIIPNQEFRIWAGYSGENILIGKFYIDSIEINANERTVTIDGRDKTKRLINKNFTSNYFTNVGNESALEYCGNVAGLSSSEMLLDVTASAIEYWLPEDQQIFTEMQKIAEAVGLQSFYIDELGNLVFSCDIETQGIFSFNFTGFYSCYDAYLLGDYLYISAYQFSVAGRLFRFNINTKELYEITCITSTAYFYFTEENNTIVISNGTNVYTYDPVSDTATTFTSIQSKLDLTYIYNPFNYWQVWGRDSANHLYRYVVAADNSVDYGVPLAGILDFQTYALDYSSIFCLTRETASVYKLYKNQSPSSYTLIGTFTGDTVNGGIVVGAYMYFIGYSNTTPGDVHIWRSDGATLSIIYTESLGTGNRWTGEPHSIAYDGAGNILFTKVVQYVTFVMAAYNIAGNTVTYYDDTIIGEYFPRGLFYSTTYAMRILVGLQLPKIFIHKLAGALAADPVDFTFTYDNTLLKLSGRISDESGGESLLITKATVKSTPLTPAGAPSTVWEASNLPIILAPSQVLIIETNLSEACLVPQTLVITAPGTTSTISSHPTKPIITITDTGSGSTITTLSIAGTRLINNGLLQATVQGPALTALRYGECSYVLENDYITNPDIPGFIAQYLINKYGNIVTWISNIEVVFTPNIQLLDRVTITETNTGINADYYVISITHSVAVGKATTILNLIKV